MPDVFSKNSAPILLEAYVVFEEQQWIWYMLTSEHVTVWKHLKTLYSQYTENIPLTRA